MVRQQVNPHRQDPRRKGDLKMHRKERYERIQEMDGIGACNNDGSGHDGRERSSLRG